MGGEFFGGRFPELSIARKDARATPISLSQIRPVFLSDVAFGRDRFVRRLRSYYGRVGLLVTVYHRLRLLAFPMRTGGFCRKADIPQSSEAQDYGPRVD